MHFNHGGVLGLTESIGRLLKGVTYDAGMDTFAHPATPGVAPAAANNAVPHPPTAPGAAPVAAPDGTHPPLHPTPTAPAGAPAAPTAGHDDDDDDSISGSIIKGLSHMGHYGAAFPVLAQGLKWAKNKMFPEIHEIPTEDQHVGDQILHKLKKNKKNKTELDHHALEGFCKGLDISNLNRTFRMFTDPIRFEAAVKREAGREEIKKEIANILDLSGEVDRGEVVTQVNLLLHLLGHHVDSRVAGQHHALRDIIQHVEAWLTEPVLAKIYGTEAKEADFTMDYDKIGDSVLKVNDKNLRPFLNRIRTDGIDDVEVKVGDLLDPANVTAELDSNPGDLREQIENLFNVKGVVTKPKLEERARQMKKRLKYEIIPPATAIAPIDPYTEIRKEFVDLIDKALANLSPATLAKLYPVAEDASTKFEWTDAKYKDFGATVLTTVTDKNRAAALNGFDVETLNTSFTGILPSIKPTALNTDAGRNKIKEQAAAFLRVTEPFDAAEVTQQATALKKRLGDGTVEALKFAEVSGRIDAAVTALTAAGVIDKLFPPEEDTGTKFEWTDAKYRDFGATVLTTVKPKNQAEALKGFDEAVFNATFNAILPTVKPAALNTEPGKKKIREQAAALLRLTEPFDAAEIIQQVTALKKRLGDGTVEATKFAEVADRLDVAATQLTAAGVIDKLFEEATWTDANNFAANFIETDNYDVPNYVKTYNSVEFRGHFHYLFEMDELDRVIASGTPEQKNEAKDQIRIFAKQNIGNVSQGRMDSIIRAYEAQRNIAKPTLETTATYQALDTDIGEIKANFDKAEDRLSKLFKPSKEPEVKTVTPDRVGNILKTEVQNKEEALAFLRGYKPSQVRDYYSILADGATLDTFLGEAERQDLADLQKLLRSFAGLNVGRVTPGYLAQMQTDFQKNLDLADPSTLSPELKNKYDHFVTLTKDVIDTLSAGKRLDKIFNPEKIEINYDKFGETVNALSNAELIPFLRQLNTALLGTNMLKFKLEMTLDAVKTPDEREELRNKLAGFFGAPEDTILTQGDVQFLAQQILGRFGDPGALQRMDRAAYSNYVALGNLMNTILGNLSEERLANLYKGAKRKKKTP